MFQLLTLRPTPQDGEEARLRARVENLEKDTGVKLRVLAQNYPETPVRSEPLLVSACTVHAEKLR